MGRFARDLPTTLLRSRATLAKGLCPTLVVTRRPGEGIVIELATPVKGKQVRLAIDGPRRLPVVLEELLAVEEEQKNQRLSVRSEGRWLVRGVSGVPATRQRKKNGDHLWRMVTANPPS